MASIRKRGNRYYIRYRDAAGVQHETAAGTSSRREAATLLAQRMGELETGVSPTGRRLTVRQAWEEFERCELPSKREGTRIAYRSAMRANILPALGDEVLATLTSERIRAAIEAMPLAKSTRKLRRNQLSGLYTWAIEKGHAYRNPCRSVKLGRGTDPRLDTIAPRHAYILIRETAPEWRAAVATLYYAGLRVGELRGLQWQDFGRWEKVVSVSNNVFREGREAIEDHGTPFSPPKTDQGTRQVPIPETLVHELRRWERETADNPKNEWNLIFPNQWGRPLRHDALNKAIGEAARRAAANPAMAKRRDREEAFVPERITARTLRHGYARLMLQLGMTLPELQRMMGHTKYSTTLRYADYEHQVRPAALAAVDAFERSGGNKAVSLATRRHQQVDAVADAFGPITPRPIRGKNGGKAEGGGPERQGQGVSEAE